jgi:hypothetical protein
MSVSKMAAMRAETTVETRVGLKVALKDGRQVDPLDDLGVAEMAES